MLLLGFSKEEFDEFVKRSLTVSVLIGFISLSIELVHCLSEWVLLLSVCVGREMEDISYIYISLDIKLKLFTKLEWFHKRFPHTWACGPLM